MTEKREKRVRTLTCAICEEEFEAEVKAGRPPKRCPSCMKKYPGWRDVGALSQRSLRLTEGDKRMMEFIQEELGCNSVEAVRTALRVYAGILGNIKKK